MDGHLPGEKGEKANAYRIDIPSRSSSEWAERVVLLVLLVRLVANCQF